MAERVLVVEEDPQLLEAALFGYERGAFTGAPRTRDGLLQVEQLVQKVQEVVEVRDRAQELTEQPAERIRLDRQVDGVQVSGAAP